MGDYNKLIIACSIKAGVKERLEAEISELGLCDSAYQSSEQIVSIELDKYSKHELNVIIIGQTKYGNGQDAFCEWLRPYVTQGSGENDVYALSFSEYSDTPQMWKLGLESGAESK